MVKQIAEKFNRLSSVHQRHRQTTDRQTTDGRPIAYSKRNVVRSLKRAERFVIFFIFFATCVILCQNTFIYELDITV